MTLGIPAVPLFLTFATAPLLLALARRVGSVPVSVPMLIAAALPLAWLVFWVGRALRQWALPHAPARWLRAVRVVIGDPMMDGILEQLRVLWFDRPDHLITYREVIEAYWGQRIDRWEAARRARGVRLHGPGSPS